MTAARAREHPNAHTWPFDPDDDGPRCPGCGEGVDCDNELCTGCGDVPHEFQQAPGDREGWCRCGRIEQIGGYSPVHDTGDGAR